MSWLSKVGDKLGDVADSVTDQVVDEVKLHASKLGNVNVGPTARKLKEASVECHGIAKETVELCDSMNSKATIMLELGAEIKATLEGFRDGGMDASALATIRDLIAGEKMKTAMALAQDMDDVALECVDKSVQMINVMERGVDSLPDVVQLAMDEAAKKGGRDDDPELTSVDKDMQDIIACIDDIKKLNLFTAMEVGVGAFNQLALKVDVSKSMFGSIRTFARDVESMTDTKTWKDINITSVTQKAKDLWRCIRLSDMMKVFAVEVGKLIKSIINLFRETSDRVSGLWAALAFAKDCMADCLQYVNDAKKLLIGARDKSTKLIDKSVAVKDDLESVGSVNARSISACRSLVEADDIKVAIKLATNMDDLVVQCTDKVMCMVDRVSEGYKELPPILTEGIPDVEEAGKAADDPEPADVQADIDELDKSREAIETSNMLSAVQAGAKGFSGVSNESKVCLSMLKTVDGFADSCMATIESFMGEWNIEGAQNKIIEMCRLAKLGDMMRQFAAQIKALLMSIIALMRAAIAKFKSINLNSLQLPDQVEDIVENVVGHVTDSVKKLQFWKK